MNSSVEEETHEKRKPQNIFLFILVLVCRNEQGRENDRVGEPLVANLWPSNALPFLFIILGFSNVPTYHLPLVSSR